MKYKIIFLLSIFPSFSFAQIFYTEGTITGFSGKKVYLFTYYGEKAKIIDSAIINANGNFKFKMKPDLTPGMLKLSFGQIASMDIIYNQENICFSSDVNNPIEKTQFTQSLENKYYYYYLLLKKGNNQKQELLNQLLANYPKDNTFYSEAKEEFIKNQNSFNIICDSITTAFPNLFVSKIIRMEEIPVISPELSPSARNEFMRSHFFDDKDFSDSTLLKSNVLTSKIITYLSFYRNPQYKKEQQEDAFLPALDTILKRVSSNANVYEFVLEYLINGFQRFGYEKALLHLAGESRLKDICVNSERKRELEQKIGNVKRLAIGQPCPEIHFTTIAEKEYTLSKSKTENTLVLFWASWCPHCKQMLPELKKIFQQLPSGKLEIVAISIDTDHKEYNKALKEGNFPWLNYCDYDGWDSKIVTDLDVFATPTMFLLDKSKTILSKPINLEELKQALDVNGIN